MTKRPIARRELLIGAGAAGVSLLVPARVDATQARQATPPQTQGPFYPVADREDKNIDLTRVDGRSGTAAGTVVLLDGVVRALDGSPLKDTMVEIWQACATGRYDHPNDRNPAALDPDFQYWGRTTTDAEGRYRFKTIKPGAYPNGSTMRPPHIHFRVVAPGRRMLTTQMYFEGDPLNQTDGILRNLSEAQRALVIVPFTSADAGALAGRFEILLGDPADPRATPELD